MKEKIRERGIIYRFNNKEKRGEYNKNYRIQHKEERKIYHHNYRFNHKDERSKKSKIYRLKNKDEIKKRNKIYNQTDHGRLSQRRAKYKRRKKFPIEVSVKEWNFIKQRDKECIYCDSNEKLTIDHIDPNGDTVIGNLAIACRSCNCSKWNRDVHEWLKQRFENEMNIN